MHLFYYFLFGKIFALIAGIYYFRFLSRPYKLVFLLVAIATFCESYGYYLNRVLHKANNLWVFNLYMIVEAWLMGVCAIYLVGNRKLKFLFILLLIIDTCIWFINIKLNSLDSFATLSMVCGSIVFTLMYLIILINGCIFNVKGLMLQPLFWLCISTILYFCCDIPYMGMRNYLHKEMPVLSKQLSFINTILDIVRYPLYGISFILLGRKKPVELKVT